MHLTRGGALVFVLFLGLAAVLGWGLGQAGIVARLRRRVKVNIRVENMRKIESKAGGDDGGENVVRLVLFYFILVVQELR